MGPTGSRESHELEEKVNVGDPAQTTLHRFDDHWKATFPTELARKLDLDDGTKLTWRVRDDGSIVVEPTSSLVDKVRGMDRVDLHSD